DVQSSRRLDDDEQLRTDVQLARQNDFLLIAAGEQPDAGERVGWAHVELFQQLQGALSSPGKVDQPAAREWRFTISAERDIFLDRHGPDDRAGQAVLRHVARSQAPHLPGRRALQRLVLEADESRVKRAQAGNRLGKLSLAIAVYAGDTHHLAG